MSSPSESDAKDEKAPPPLKLPPLFDADIPPSNDVPAHPSNDVTLPLNVDDEVKTKRIRNRRKPHGKKGAAKNADSKSTDMVAEKDESTNETVIQGVETTVKKNEKKLRKRHPYKKSQQMAQDQPSQGTVQTSSQNQDQVEIKTEKQEQNQACPKPDTNPEQSVHEGASTVDEVADKKKRNRRQSRNKKPKSSTSTAPKDAPRSNTIGEKIKVQEKRHPSPNTQFNKNTGTSHPVAAGATATSTVATTADAISTLSANKDRNPESFNNEEEKGRGSHNQYAGNQNSYQNQYKGSLNHYSGNQNVTRNLYRGNHSNNQNSNQNQYNGNQNSNQNQSRGNQNANPNRHRGQSLNGQQNNSGSNRNKFPGHLHPDQIQLELEKGRLIEGYIRINPKNYKDAFVSSPGGRTADIMVSDILNRNQSLEGDLVVVALNDQSEWLVLHDLVFEQLENDEQLKKMVEKLEKNRGNILQSDITDGEETEDVIVEEIVYLENGQEVGREAMPQQEAKSQAQIACGNRSNGQFHRIKSLNDEKKLFSLDLVMQLPDWEQYVQRTGRVVGITERNHTRKAAGHLEIFPDGNPNYGFFKPLDNRIPRMKIPKESCPPEFFIRPEDFKQYLFVAQIEKWDMVTFALGKLIHNLGMDTDIEARTQAILMENDIDNEEFNDEVIRCLPELPFVIPEDEIKKRRDFRSECVFTVDPLTARDLDDALSVVALGSGRYRVGVHIADVSYFVREHSTLDHVASQRATSVYMVQTVVPMLPRTLCENLCSLNPGVDRLTFSVEWIMSETGEIEQEWFGRTVINSCVKLAYEHAQHMIDDPDRDWNVEELPPIESPWVARDISDRVNMLQKIAVNLRQKRVDAGAMRIDQPKICFTLDKESWLPTGYRLYEHRHSNRLIEEFMLLANMSVAKKLYTTFPDLALLRCHPPPPPVQMEKVVKMLKPYGIPIDGTNSKTVQQSFDNFRRKVFGEKPETEVKKPKKDVKRKPEAEKDDRKSSQNKNGRKSSTKDDVEVLAENIEAVKLDSTDSSVKTKQSDRLKKSEVARAHVAEGEVGKMSKKLYAMQDPSKESSAMAKFMVLMSLCAKPMKNAVYFCAMNKPVNECRHYALSVDLYTHFTSPIRRYPDVMVHRLLDAALQESKPEWETKTIAAICRTCNSKKLMAKKVSDESDKLFLTMFVKECGPMTVSAMVICVNDCSVDCLLLDMAVTRRVYFDELSDLKSYKFMIEKGKKVMELKWKEKSELAATVPPQETTGSASSSVPESPKPSEKLFVQKLQLFSLVNLTLQEKTAFDFSAVLNAPLN